MPHIINGVQCRTKIESLKHIIEQANLGNIGPNVAKGDCQAACQYTYESGNHCAVGSLFSEAQLKLIDEGNENNSNIQVIAETFGKNNVEAVTGMTVNELRTLQSVHDEAFGSMGLHRDEAIKKVVDKAQSMLEKALAQV